MKKRRIEMVEVLRGVAAFAVAWFHFTNGNPRFLDDGLLKASGAYGWVGVHVFFVISGFVIPLAMYAGRYRLGDYFRFLSKRLVRLEPPYLLSIVVVIVLWHISALIPGFRGESPQWSVTQILAHAGYLAPVFNIEWLNPVYWSLGVEFQYYLAIALLFPLVASQSAAIRAPTIGFLCMLSFVFDYEHALFSYLSLFVLGIVVFHYYVGFLKIDRLMVAFVLVGAAIWSEFGAVVAISAVVAASLIVFFPHFKLKPLLVLGTISYSFYLLHVPIGGRIINLAERLDLNAVGQFVAVLVAAGVSIVAAGIYFWVVERPSTRLSARLRYKNPRNEKNERLLLDRAD